MAGSTPEGVNVKDIDPDTRRKLGLRLPRQTTFSAEECRSRALRVLATIADLTRGERARVLNHALKVNRV
jgi:hypothetical protein